MSPSYLTASLLLCSHVLFWYLDSASSYIQTKSRDHHMDIGYDAHRICTSNVHWIFFFPKLLSIPEPSYLGLTLFCRVPFSCLRYYPIQFDLMSWEGRYLGSSLSKFWHSKIFYCLIMNSWSINYHTLLMVLRILYSMRH